MKASERQEVIRSQLTLRAVIWDVKEVSACKLEQEMELFEIDKLVCNRTELTDSKKIFEEAVGRCMQNGISRQETLLVTEDAGIAEYVYRQRYKQNGQMAGWNYKNGKMPELEKGCGVVYYEKEGSRANISADMIVLGFTDIGVQFLDRIQKRRNQIPWNILYTKRTHVREITLEDLDELYQLYEGEGITDYTEPLYERPKEEEYVKSYIDSMYYYYGYGMWIIRDRKTHSLIGRAGIEHREAEGEQWIELGYIIGKEYQNKGYATEVCTAIMEYAQEELDIKKLHCFIHPENKVSVHLAEKLGFVRHAGSQRKQGELLHYDWNVNGKMV